MKTYLPRDADVILTFEHNTDGTFNTCFEVKPHGGIASPVPVVDEEERVDIITINQTLHDKLRMQNEYIKLMEVELTCQLKDAYAEFNVHYISGDFSKSNIYRAITRRIEKILEQSPVKEKQNEV